MEAQYEELAKGLAEGLSRRELLRRLAGFLGGCALVTVGLEGRAWGQSGCRELCRDTYKGRSRTARRNRRHCRWVCETQCGGAGGTCQATSPSGGQPITRCLCDDGACPEYGEVCCGATPCPTDQCCDGICCPDGETCCGTDTCCPMGKCCRTGSTGVCCPDDSYCKYEQNDPASFGTCVSCNCPPGLICCPDGRCLQAEKCCPCFIGNEVFYAGAPADAQCCWGPCGTPYPAWIPFCPAGTTCCNQWTPVGGARCLPAQCV